MRCSRLDLLGFTIFVSLVLSGCNFLPGFGAAFPDFSANETTIKMLFETAGRFLYEENGQQVITLYCGVTEGIHCFYLEHATAESYDGTWNPDIDNAQSQISRDVAREIFNSGGWKFVEHSQNNAVKVRCQQSTEELMTCEVDRGGGWQPLPIR